MRLKSRLTPYPILYDQSDDYIESSFSVQFDVVTRFSEIYGKLSFKLCDDMIQQLIDDRTAEFVAHIECPMTCFRMTAASFDSEVEFKFDASQVTNLIEIRTFIILTKDVTDFTSSHFHPDYQGNVFDLKAHQIIAIGTAIDYRIQKDDRDLDNLPSIIRITKLTDKKKGTMSVDTDSDNHISIGLSDHVFDLYARLGKNAFKATAFSLILLPAMVIVLQRMYLNRTDDSITSMHWYQVIESILEKNGKAVEDINIETDSLLALCQSIFADPITRSLKELESCSERME